MKADMAAGTITLDKRESCLLHKYDLGVIKGRQMGQVDALWQSIRLLEKAMGKQARILNWKDRQVRDGRERSNGNRTNRQRGSLPHRAGRHRR